MAPIKKKTNTVRNVVRMIPTPATTAVSNIVDFILDPSVETGIKSMLSPLSPISKMFNMAYTFGNIDSEEQNQDQTNTQPTNKYNRKDKVAAIDKYVTKHNRNVEATRKAVQDAMARKASEYNRQVESRQNQNNLGKTSFTLNTDNQGIKNNTNIKNQNSSNFDVQAFQNWVLQRNAFNTSKGYSNSNFSLGKYGADGIMGKYTRNAYNALKDEYNRYLKSGNKNYQDFYNKHIYIPMQDTNITKTEINPQLELEPASINNVDVLNLDNTTKFALGGRMIPKYQFGNIFSRITNNSLPTNVFNNVVSTLPLIPFSTVPVKENAIAYTLSRIINSKINEYRSKQQNQNWNQHTLQTMTDWYKQPVESGKFVEYANSGVKSAVDEAKSSSATGTETATTPRAASTGTSAGTGAGTTGTTGTTGTGAGTTPEAAKTEATKPESLTYEQVLKNNTDAISDRIGSSAFRGAYRDAINKALKTKDYYYKGQGSQIFDFKLPDGTVVDFDYLNNKENNLLNRKGLLKAGAMRKLAKRYNNAGVDIARQRMLGPIGVSTIGVTSPAVSQPSNQGPDLGGMQAEVNKYAEQERELELSPVYNEGVNPYGIIPWKNE